MMTITAEGISGNTMEELDYIESRSLIGRIVMPITRWLRAINAEPYISSGERLLDIGCGDGYFIKRQTKITERYGLDMRLGDKVKNKLDCSDQHFDYVTMLAVIEHINNPEDIFQEVYRVLRPQGKLICTTPKESAEWLINLYVKEIEEEHETYCDVNRVKQLAGDNVSVTDYKTFIFGLNQVFFLTRNS